MNMIEIKKTLFVAFICLMGGGYYCLGTEVSSQTIGLGAGLIVQLCCKHSAR